PMIADDLRRQADNFIELEELREVIGRPPREDRFAAARMAREAEDAENGAES
ncbi:MAG: NYN domain-containing protein, partial [Thermohalobaculum sp.]|nr:NYN domain-containing protein [Thermohalobaculum sp.]